LTGQKVGINLKGSIGLKAIMIVVIVAVAHQYYIMEFPDDEEMTIATFSLSIASIAAAITSFSVSKRYWGSEVFGKTYLALAISFCFLLAGDLTYIYYDWYSDEAPYPSIADVFFFLSYPLAGYHLVKNINHFKQNLGIGPKIGVLAVSGLLVASFAFVTVDLLEEEPVEFYLGLLFVLVSSTILGLAFLGAAVFRDSVLGTAWLVLAAGIFVYTVADVWYYATEVVDGYGGDHFVNTLWVLGLAVITYALYKHKKTI
jgi:hypothetical protein